jgi:hypothetical protein
VKLLPYTRINSNVVPPHTCSQSMQSMQGARKVFGFKKVLTAKIKFLHTPDPETYMLTHTHTHKEIFDNREREKREPGYADADGIELLSGPGGGSRRNTKCSGSDFWMMTGYHMLMRW